MGIDAVAPSHPKPNEKDTVTFYLGRGIRGVATQTDRQQYVPVGVNGYNYTLKMGAKNTVPRDVYQQLMNSRSRSVVVDLEKAQKSPQPWAGGGFGSNSPKRYETLMDYEIELIKEGA